MSKVDAQRAIREARFARFAVAKKSEESTRPKVKTPVPATEELFAAPALTKVSAKPSRAKATKPNPADELEMAESAADVAAPADLAELTAPAEPESAPDVAAAPEPEAAEAEAETEELCGHRSMNGKNCTREKNHPQKNHRYN